MTRKLYQTVPIRKCLKISTIFWLFFFISLLCLIWPQKHSFYKAAIKVLRDKGVLFRLTKIPNFKYILVWTLPTQDPIVYLETENKTFIKRNCPYTNCYVSSDRDLFESLTDYDMIVFHGPNIIETDLPDERSPYQKYIYASMESSDYYPVCSDQFNGYFNWTWTYKLNSDVEYGYISIWNKQGEVVGPKEEMHWEKLEDMMPIDDDLRRRLGTKLHAAAWFVSNCETPSRRELFAEELKGELSKYNLQLHIYGACGTRSCPRSMTSDCLRLLGTYYYFYLSFENSFSEDYVTEKLLHALNHYTVPVVLGGANYTRFMPDGMYLDARKLSIADLALQMAEIINDTQRYYNFFKWRNHYSYHDVVDSAATDPYCKLCAMANDQEKFQTTSIYDRFVEWWTPPGKCPTESAMQFERVSFLSKK